MRIENISLHLITFILLLSILACSSGSYRETDLRTRLNNRGPVALSSDNPYLAANQFVVEQSDQSEVINGFIGFRGAPNAIEIISSYFAKPVIYYYYTDKREFYTIEQLSHTWVVSGPERINEEKYSRISELTASFIGRPTLTKQIDKNNTFLPVANKSSSNLRANSQVSPSTQAPIKTPSPIIASNNKLSGVNTSNKVDLVRNSIVDPKESQLIEDIKNYQAQYGQTNAEITPKGDLVHYVTFPGESLSLIARWYTHDRSNAERLARINRLTEPNKLELGDIIVVPSYLLKSKVIFTKNILDSLVQKSK